MLLRTASLALFALVLATPASKVWAGVSTSPQRVPGEYLITLKESAEVPKALNAAFGDLGLATVEGTKASDQVFRIRVETDPGLAAMHQRGIDHPNIEQVQPNYRYSVPDPLRRDQPLPVHP